MKALILAFALFYSPLSFANTIMVLAGEKTSVPIHSSLGSIIQLPRAVRTVTPAWHYTITDMGTDPLQKMDVKTFQIKAKGVAPMEEVIFVLADGVPITLQFFPDLNASKYYSIQLADPLKDTQKSKFLANELLMMRSMLRDEPGGFDRKVVSQKISTSLKDFAVELKRIYSSSQFTGYVFLLKNKSGKPQRLSPNLLSFDSPNQALLAHIDNEELPACPALGENLDCLTGLRIIVKGSADRGTLNLGLASDKTPPFEKKSDVMEGVMP